MDEVVVEGAGEGVKGQGVADAVVDLGAARHGAELVLVMPEGVGAATLDVDEVVGRIDVRNLGDPFDGDAEKRANAIANDEAGIDAFGWWNGDLEAHVGRGDAG